MRLETTPEEPGRREQTLDAGAETVVALYRLARVAQMHDPSNQAYQRQIEQTEQAVVDYCGRAGRFFSVLFTPSATFVGGELLRGPRGTQDFAAELGTLLEARGISEIIITREVTPEDIFELSRLLAPGPSAPFSNARIRVRSVEDTARARGLVVEHLPIDRHIARTYGEAVVAVRRLFDELLSGRYLLPPRIKRIAQSLVDLAAGQNPFFVGVSETAHPSSDEALRAVHAAILSAAMAREIGADRAKSVDIVMAALLHDVALPRIRARAVEQTGRTGEAPEADAELPAGTAATMGGFSGLFEESMVRGVVSFEAQWGRFTGPLGPLYHGARPPTLQARIVAIAHEWSRLRLSPLREQPKSADAAVAALIEDLRDPSDLAVARLLFSTLRFYPPGTVVELDTKEIAEVVSSGEVGHGTPLVRVTHDESGAVLDTPHELDLADESAPRRAVVRVRSVEGWRRRERPTAPHDPAVQRTSTPDAPRGSLPSISPGFLDGGAALPGAIDTGSDFIQILRTELNEQLSEVFPREKSTPNIDEAVVAEARASAKALLSPDSVAAASSSKPRPSLPQPAAKGTFATTPLVHVLIYVLDHGITGSIELVEADGQTTHAIYVRRGAPVKVKTGRLVAPLGELLASAGKLALDRVPDLVLAAQRDGVLFGERLISQGLISRGQLWSTLELQIPLKLERLANLAPDTKYVLYKDVNQLETWGGSDAVAADPVHVIHSVVRAWHDRARIKQTLTRIGKHPLIIRPDAKVGGLKLAPDERAVLDAIREQRATMSVLQHMRLADAEALNSLVYTLAITRQLELPSQKKSGPMGLRAASLPAPPQRHSAPPARRKSSADLAAVSPSAAPGPRRTQSSAEITAVPSIADAIASALSAPPPPGGVEVGPLPPPASAPLVDMSSPMSSSLAASPLSSTGVPPVSSSRERLSEGARRVPSSSGTPAASPASSAQGSTSADALDQADRSLEAMGRFRMAEAALVKGDFLTAESLVREAVALDGEPIDYRATLVWISSQSTPTERLADPLDAMTDLLVEHPEHPRVLLYRARLLRRQGRTREAIADYEAHLKVSPKSKEALAELKALRG